jgi:periplasmic divalent cation tolerance protein
MDKSEGAFRVVLTTAGSDEQAEAVARALVDGKLAACVNIIGQTCSVYRWKGDVVREEEKLLVIKTTAALFPRVCETIREVHTYEVPEILSLPVTEGDPTYLAWIDESTGV